MGDREGVMRPLPPLEGDSMSSLMPETVDVDEWEPCEERLRRIAGMSSTEWRQRRRQRRVDEESDDERRECKEVLDKCRQGEEDNKLQAKDQRLGQTGGIRVRGDGDESAE